MNNDFAGKHVLGFSVVFLELCRFTSQEMWHEYRLWTGLICYWNHIRPSNTHRVNKQANTQTNRRRWKHPTLFATLWRLV